MIIARRPAPRIAFLIESDGPGGAEQVVAHLAEAFTTRGYLVSLLVPAAGEGWLRQRLHGTGVRVEELPLAGPLSLRASVALAAALREQGIDLLHTHEFGEALTGAVAARWLGIPHVLTMHGGGYYAERARRRALLRLAIGASRATTAVAEPLAAELRARLRLPTGAIEVIPNGARPAGGTISRGGRPPGLPGQGPLVVAIGNLYPVKGHRHLIDALALLRSRHPGLHLAIAGRGEEEPALLAHARAAGLAERVHLLGLRHDVGALLAAADLFIHPSLAEGLPLAVLEAMFASRPIIASAVGAIPVALEGGAAGRLVRPGDPAMLASAIDELLLDPTLARALAQRAGARAAAEYTVERMTDRYDDLYQRLLSPNGAR
jgi:glycosyltransferase involved in cell wall biosynthesis